MSKDDPLFAKGKAQWLLENARKLTPDQRALLLAIDRSGCCGRT